MASAYPVPVIYRSSLILNASETVSLRTDNEAVCRGTRNERRLDVAKVERHVGDVFFFIRVIVVVVIERVNLLVSRA
jgi:hypothetical protein